MLPEHCIIRIEHPYLLKSYSTGRTTGVDQGAAPVVPSSVGERQLAKEANYEFLGRSVVSVPGRDSTAYHGCLCLHSRTLRFGSERHTGVGSQRRIRYCW